MRCQNERKKLARIIYQATCYGIKLESGDLPRFFMIDEMDHVSKIKVVRLSVSESSCGRSSFCEVVFLRSFFGLELRMRMLKRHEVCHFSSGVGARAPELHYGDCARQVNALSRCFPLRRNDHSLREVEQMRRSGNKLRPGQANVTK